MQKGLVALALALTFFILAPTAHAQGWDTVKKPRFGLEYKVPRDYQTIPPSPLEKYIVLIYQEEWDEDRKPQRELLPRIEVIQLDHSEGVASPKTGGEDAEEEEDGDEVLVDEENGVVIVVEKPPAVNSVATYVEHELRGWELGQVFEQEEVDGYTYKQYELNGEKGRRGYIYAYSNTKRTVAFVGYCHRDDLDEVKDDWDEMVKRIEIEEPDLEKWEKERQKHVRFYERKKKFLDPEFRINTRMDLADGWEADDTENYILVFSTKDQPLIRLIKKELEAMRKEYERLFPPLAPVTAVSRVRICKDEAEYRSYGGPPGSGGYWNSAEEELVFFDYENVEGQAGTGKANSRIVLYHEAFHQYIYYSAGSFAPHSWFNEGTGDYFSGAKLRGSKVTKIDINPWRIETIQYMIESRRYAPLDEIIEWEQYQYYGANEYGLPGGMLYAQGWSMIYFLRESREAQKHEVWSTVLDIYFETLREEFSKGMVELEEKGMADFWPAKRELELECRKKAVEVAFDDVDFDELEEAWKEFVMDLKAPR